MHPIVYTTPICGSCNFDTDFTPGQEDKTARTELRMRVFISGDGCIAEPL